MAGHWGADSRNFVVPDDVSIDAAGLRDFAKDLRKMRPAVAKEFTRALKDIAGEVSDDARKRAQSQGGSAAKGAKSITPRASGATASVSMGGARAPWMSGSEFGSKQFKQFKPWRGNQWIEWAEGNVGYFLHPAIRAAKTKTEDKLMDAVQAAAERTAFPD